MTEESRVSRTPRTWTEADIVDWPKDHPDVKDRRGTTWRWWAAGDFYTTDWNEAASWRQLCEKLGPLVEVLPDAPEPQPEELEQSHRLNEAPGAVTRWTVNIGPRTAEALNWVVDSNGVTYTEAIRMLAAAGYRALAADLPAGVSSVSPEGETTSGEGEGGRSDLKAAVRAVLAAFNPSEDAVWPTRSREFAGYLVEQVEAAFLANGWKRFEDYERALTEEIERRDEAEDWADRLAAAIAPPHVVGEHSLKNHPWRNALKWARENRPLSGVELRDVEERDDASEEDQ